MKRLLPLALVSAAVIAVGLFDYPNWLARRAETSYSSGDLTGALSAWSSLAKAPGWAAGAEFNRGVGLCRMGNYSGAIGSFRKAASSGDNRLRSRALYNLGTSRIQLAGNATAKGAAEANLKEAVSSLQQCLALEPSDAAAAANLKVAQTRLVALVQGDKPRQAPDERRQRREERERKDQQARPKEPIKDPAPKPGRSTAMDQAGGKRRQAAVDKNQALRMLDAARGREALRSSSLAATRVAPEAKPEKDW